MNTNKPYEVNTYYFNRIKKNLNNINSFIYLITLLTVVTFIYLTNLNIIKNEIDYMIDYNIIQTKKIIKVKSATNYIYIDDLKKFYEEKNIKYKIVVGDIIFISPISFIYRNVNAKMNYLTDLIIVIIIFLFIYLIYYIQTNKYFVLFQNELKILIDITNNYNESVLSNTNIKNMARILHHEIQTPLKSLEYSIKEYQNILYFIYHCIDNDKIEYLKISNNCNKKCRTEKNYECSLKNICPYIVVNETSSEYIKNINEMSLASLKSIKTTLNLTRGLKTATKNNISVYDIIYQSLLIINISNELKKINYEINNYLKKCFINSNMNTDNLLNIFINLIKNAVEANATFIRFDFDTNDIFYDEITKIKLSVSDNGNGIPDVIHSKLFKIDVSTKKTKNSERGIGLYLTKQLLNDDKGDILLEKTSKEGTTFIIILPVKNCYK